MDKKTVFSPDRQYRYTLWRTGLQQHHELFTVCTGRENQYCQFIGLNPSIADETIDDPTLKRCVSFARRWGFGALCMTNLFAFCATKPRVMKKASEPIGPINDWWLKEIATQAGLIVAAWGTDGAFLNRAAAVRSLLADHSLTYFRPNDDGSPEHPLYMPSDVIPTLWQP